MVSALNCRFGILLVWTCVFFRLYFVGQERFRTITTAYYRGAMGILLVYDCTDKDSFANIRNWIRNIETHAADSVNKVLIGNKCDMLTDKAIETTRGQALADEYGMKFFETSAKNNINVEEAFISIARDIKKRIMDNPQAVGGKPGAGKPEDGLFLFISALNMIGGVTLGAKPNQSTESGCCK